MEKPTRSSRDSGVALQPPPPALDQMVENAADAVLASSPEHEILWANRAATRLWGCGSSEDLIGMDFLDLIVPDCRNSGGCEHATVFVLRIYCLKPETSLVS